MYKLITNRVDVAKINEIIGCHVDNLVFFQSVTKTTSQLGIPYILIDDIVMPVFTDHVFEMQYPSHLIPNHFVRQQHKGDIVLSLMTALVVNETKSVMTDIEISSFVLLKNFSPDAWKKGINNVNFINKWLPMVLMYKYYKDSSTPSLSYMYMDMAYNNGFVWTQDAVGYMDNYYSNRIEYPQLRDFMPQLAGYLSYIADMSDEIKADYDVKKQPYVVGVYPARGTVLDMDNDSIVITVKFSQDIRCLQSIKVNSLHGNIGHDAYSYAFVDPTILKFQIHTSAAKSRGFYGIEITDNHVNNTLGCPLTKDFRVNYCQPA